MDLDLFVCGPSLEVIMGGICLSSDFVLSYKVDLGVSWVLNALLVLLF